MQVELSVFRLDLERFANKNSLPPIEARYEQLAGIDPYPTIPNALLNAGHLASYLITSGVVDPLDFEDLEKPASLLVRLEGDVRYVDEQGVTQSFYLSENAADGEGPTRAYFDLHPNSICYVTLKPTFRMPFYLAGRFNLLIRDVYRGLLVGTGPLVDPGFIGQLHIPLHNFTSSKYRFHAGEGFVYFEFTKLSWTNPPGVPLPSWIPQPIENQPPFPRSKNKRRKLDDYLSQATSGGPPGNVLLQQLQKVSEISNETSKRLRIITVSAIAAAVTVLLTVLGVIVATWQIFMGAQQFNQTAINDFASSLDKLRNRIEVMEKRGFDSNSRNFGKNKISPPVDEGVDKQ